MNSEERMKVLQMVEEKKISVEEAEKLLAEMADTEQLPVVKTSNSKKFLCIEVMDGEEKGKIFDTFFDKEIIKAIEEGADGKLVDIQEKNGAKVSIYLK